MKKILGLDLGTNSIGWALTNNDFDNKLGNIEGLGSRIIPMSQDVLGKFDSGVSISQTAERTQKRGARRLVQRFLLRRERLNRVLNILNFLPKHYSESLDFDKRFGQFKPETEEKLSFYKNENGKNQFVFLDSHKEMLAEFKLIYPDLKKVPYDWTIYYLRKKALTVKITKEELAWLLLNFNQKRGYYQLRGEEQEVNKNKLEEFHTLTIVDVLEREKGKTGIWYNVILENGWVYKRESKTPLFDWVGKQKAFIVTTAFNDDGTIKLNKENEEKRSFRSPKEDDWSLVKIRTEQTINQSGKSVGSYIYDALLKDPNQKINGKLVRTIERKFYKQELAKILKTQIPFHPELQNAELYFQAVNDLYKHNEAHKNNIKSRGFDYLFLEDIIFYQRPLKSKASLISDCSLEYRTYIKNGILEKQTVKCIAKSHPLFQEFRLWQFLQNLKIYKKELLGDVDITFEFLKSELDYVKLFAALNDKKDITQKQFLTIYKLKEDKYRWNYVEDKTYPCNETRSQFLSKIAKIEGMQPSFFNTQNSEDLWHILYSVTDKVEVDSAINKFATKHALPDGFAESFANLPPYKKDYGAFSSKAIKKFLPLMRIGSHWNENNIDPKTLDRINKIIDAEYDENIKTRVREKAINLTKLEHFKGLPLWLASYVVYDKHSESNDLSKWTSPADIDLFLKKDFKQHSLRNPIVEQVITETLRTVKDIWEHYGNGKPDFFDEIHIELGREMKNPAEKRKQMTNIISKNENTNLRIKAVLEELKNGGFEEVRPYSPSQQEILKIYEEGIYSNETNKDQLETIDKIRRSNKPSTAEIQRYKLWLNQGYISPYTGEIIKLTELFSTKYQIEHIFPQSRFFDDSLTNKIICESEVNSLKDNQTAMEFINKHKGEKVTLSNGKTVTVFMPETYKTHVASFFAKNRTKLKNLLSEEIPESFIQRQMNDSRYISKVVKMYLSKIVREQQNGELEQEATSKNVISISGSITSQMKQDWGLNDVWNGIITPRFERLNIITNSNEFGQWENKKGKKVFQTKVPDAIAKGFSKKRIDHRHHALDALVIACVNRTHINYLNNLNAKNQNDKTVKYELKNKICYKTKPDSNGNYKWEFHKPWKTFTQETRNQLLETIVSFKQNTRVINKTVNKYQNYKDEKGVLNIGKNGKPEKLIIKQTKGDNWAIRKPLHAETVSGKVSLKRIKQSHISIANAIEQVELIVHKEIKKQLNERIMLYPNNNEGLKNHLKAFPIIIKGKTIDKVHIYEKINATATRKTLDITFDEKRIEKITDTGIQKILLNHLKLEVYQNVIDENGKKILAHEIAFSESGLDELNKNIIALNNGKNHQPIKKVRMFEESGRFSLGVNGNKKDKFVETASGTNLFFAIYKDNNGKRNYKTIPLNEVIESQKLGAFEKLKPNECSVPKIQIDEKTQELSSLLFYLNPNDLVYVPTVEEIENPTYIKNFTKEQIERIYKFTDSSDTTCNFIPSSSSDLIFNINKKDQLKNGLSFPIQNEYGLGSPQSKNQNSLSGFQIKSICWKVEVDRLGKIKKIIL